MVKEWWTSDIKEWLVFKSTSVWSQGAIDLINTTISCWLSFFDRWWVKTNQPANIQPKMSARPQTKNGTCCQKWKIRLVFPSQTRVCVLLLSFWTEHVRASTTCRVLVSAIDCTCIKGNQSSDSTLRSVITDSYFNRLQPDCFCRHGPQRTSAISQKHFILSTLH